MQHMSRKFSPGATQFLSFLFQLKERNNEECAYTKILAILWLTINFFPFWFK